MSCRPPFISPGALSVFVKRYFPFTWVEEKSVKALDGYDDRNYLFVGELITRDAVVNTAPVMKQFVLKFLNSRDSSDVGVVNGFNKLLKFLHERKFDCPFPVPSVCGSDLVVVKHSDLLPYTTDDEYKTGVCNGACNGLSGSDRQYCVRVFHYVEGDVLGYDDHSPEVIHSYGSYIGRMDHAMMEFSDDNLKNRHFVEWDLKHLTKFRERLSIVFPDDHDKEEMLRETLDDFEKHVVPIMNDIEYGCIHNDVNCMNIIVRREAQNTTITGVIDFSDCVFCPYVFDLGIALAYLMSRNDDPINFVAPFVQGYLSNCPLSKKSLDILYYVVLGRIAQSLTNSAEGYRLNPTNKYILIDAEVFWQLNKILRREGKQKCYECWGINE